MRSLRRAAFTLLALYILLSPAYIQVLGGRSRFIQPWRMYSARGGGICAVRYFRDGQPLDRYAALGLTRREAPKNVRRVTSEQQAREIGDRLCDRLSGSAVTMELRCADQKRFQSLGDRSEDLCAR
jgi:hypothetical protein